MKTNGDKSFGELLLNLLLANSFQGGNMETREDYKDYYLEQLIENYGDMTERDYNSAQKFCYDEEWNLGEVGNMAEAIDGLGDAWTEYQKQYKEGFEIMNNVIKSAIDYSSLETVDVYDKAEREMLQVIEDLLKPYGAEIYSSRRINGGIPQISVTAYFKNGWSLYTTLHGSSFSSSWFTVFHNKQTVAEKQYTFAAEKWKKDDSFRERDIKSLSTKLEYAIEQMKNHEYDVYANKHLYPNGLPEGVKAPPVKAFNEVTSSKQSVKSSKFVDEDNPDNPMSSEEMKAYVQEWVDNGEFKKLFDNDKESYAEYFDDFGNPKWYKIYKDFLDIGSNGAFSEINSSRRNNMKKTIESAVRDHYLLGKQNFLTEHVFGIDDDGDVEYKYDFGEELVDAEMSIFEKSSTGFVGFDIESHKAGKVKTRHEVLDYDGLENKIEGSDIKNGVAIYEDSNGIITVATMGSNWDNTKTGEQGTDYTLFKAVDYNAEPEDEEIESSREPIKSSKWVEDVADKKGITFEQVLEVFKDNGYGEDEADDFWNSKWNDVSDAFGEDGIAGLGELFGIEITSSSKKGDKNMKIQSKRLIKSGPGAGYDVTVRGIELDNRNWKILSDDYDEQYDSHTVQVEVPVKPCVAEYWAAESYYEGIDSSHDIYDSKVDRQIDGGTAILQLEVYPPQWIKGDIMTSEELDEAIGDLLPSELNLTMMYGGGWLHSYLPEEGIVFDDDNGRIYLDEGETYDYTTVRCELKCPNITQNINAFFRNPDAYYDEDEMPQYPGEDDEIANSRKPVTSGLTFRQAVQDFKAAGQWNDYYEMQQDWEAYKDGLERDGVISEKTRSTWGNPCTPEGFKRWNK